MEGGILRGGFEIKEVDVHMLPSKGRMPMSTYLLLFSSKDLGPLCRSTLSSLNAFLSCFFALLQVSH